MTIPAPALSDIRLIATDLDGTLLKGWRKDVDPDAFPLIEELSRHGIVFFAASGRQYPSLRRLFEPVRDEIGYVCENGAMAIYRDEVVFKRAIPREKAPEIFHTIEAHPDCEVFASGQETAYIVKGNQDFRDHLTNVTKCDVTEIDRVEDIEEPIIKIAFRVPAEKNAAISEHFQGAFGEGYRVVTSGTVWIDVIQDGVDKGTALETVGEQLGITFDQMMAFGDELNDAEMIAAAGHPYVMDTGNPELQMLNDRVHICSRVEDELASLLGR